MSLAAHERKGKKKRRKKKSGPRRLSKASRATSETKVKLAERLALNPDQCLVILASKQFCRPHKETQLNQKESLALQLRTVKHKAALERFKGMPTADRSTSETLSEFFADNKDVSGVSASPRMQLVMI
ncbi:MAG: hypothetical protein SGPRY_008533 [Prymnesium sp.]